MAEQPTGGDTFLAVLAYLPVLNLLPIVKRRKDRFLMYHARQGLYLFSVFIVFFSVVLGLFWIFHNLVPIEFVETVLAVLVVGALVAYMIIVVWMILAVMRHRMPMLPVLGEFAGER